MPRAPLLHALILVILVIGASDAKRLSGMHMSAYERLSIEGDDKIHLNSQRQRHQMKRRQMKPLWLNRRQMKRLRSNRRQMEQLWSNRRIELDLLQVIILFFGPNSTPQLPPGLISRGHICFCVPWSIRRSVEKARPTDCWKVALIEMHLHIISPKNRIWKCSLLINSH